MNPRPTAPKAAALAKLRYAPMLEKMQYYKRATFSERKIVDRTKKIGVLRLAQLLKCAPWPAQTVLLE